MAKAQKMRQQSLETMGESRKRKLNEDVEKKRKHCSRSETILFLEEKIKLDTDMNERELYLQQVLQHKARTGVNNSIKCRSKLKVITFSVLALFLLPSFVFRNCNFFKFFMLAALFGFLLGWLCWLLKEGDCVFGGEWRWLQGLQMEALGYWALYRMEVLFGRWMDGMVDY